MASDDTVTTSNGPRFTLPSVVPTISFSQNPQKIILISMVTAGLVSIIENAAGPNLTNVPANQVASVTQQWSKTHASIPTILVSTFLAGAILLAMSYFLPEFAGGLAVIALVVTIFERGKPFWDIVTTLSGGTPPSSLPPTPAQQQSAAAFGQAVNAQPKGSFFNP